MKRLRTQVSTGLKRVYFIRHGQSEANAKLSDTILERDAKLTSLGQAQASCWNEENHLEKTFGDSQPEICFCSPLRRAMETACLVFKNEPKIPIECSRFPRERWWLHYQCVGEQFDETIKFAKTMPREVDSLDGLRVVDKYWNPEQELEEANAYVGDDGIRKEGTGKYVESLREQEAQGISRFVQQLQEHDAQSIAVACHWGTIFALTGASPSNCDMLVTDMNVESGEFQVVAQLAPPGNVEKSV